MTEKCGPGFGRCNVSIDPNRTHCSHAGYCGLETSHGGENTGWDGNFDAMNNCEVSGSTGLYPALLAIRIVLAIAVIVLIYWCRKKKKEEGVKKINDSFTSSVANKYWKKLAEAPDPNARKIVQRNGFTADGNGDVPWQPAARAFIISESAGKPKKGENVKKPRKKDKKSGNKD